MPNLLFISRHLLKGKTLGRTVLDYRLLSEELSGEIIDLGSGASSQYSEFIPKAKGARLNYFDQKIGQATDFEKDTLPANQASFDTVLFLNVLEHIFNHRHILKEINRIKKPDGRLLGFVPFLKWYHADPRDFFRYTHEALEILLKETGFTEIKIEPLYLGPYSTAFDLVLPTLPRLTRPILYLPCALLDFIFRAIRPASAKRYVLGYYFECR